MKPLLVLVDLQNDFLDNPDLYPPAGLLIDEAAALLAAARSRFIDVAHVWTTIFREQDNRMPHWREANVWRCVEGTAGHRPPDVLAPRAGEPVFHKNGLSALTASDLKALSLRLGVDTLIVAGLKTHACVRQLALEAWEAGLNVWISTDALASDDPLHAASSRRLLEARAVAFLPTAEIIRRLDTPGLNIAASANGLDQAPIAAAQGFSLAWRRTSLEERAGYVQRLGERLAADAERLPVLIAREIGKPVRFARAELEQCLGMLDSVVRRAKETSVVLDEGHDHSLRRRPHGVVAAITPWNNPIYIPLGKIVPAMIFQNTIVWKPAPEALAVSRFLLDCFKRAGWPGGLINVVEGGQREAEALMNDSAIAAVTITGSSAAGYSAQEVCARRRIPLQAELGGNNAAIVWRDADLELAACAVARGAFEMAGQRCTANRRAIVHEACRADFLRLVEQETAKLQWGDPLNPATQIGPLVNSTHRSRVAGTVARAAASCGEPLHPLGELPPNGAANLESYYPPTVLCCGSPEAEIVQEETFGPVLVVQPARNWDQAIGLCNGVKQGLAAAVFTSSPDIVQSFLDQAQAGILKVNQCTAGGAVDAPFGGWKGSGIGVPEHGSFDVEFFTRPQTVYRGRGSTAETPDAGAID